MIASLLFLAVLCAAAEEPVVHWGGSPQRNNVSQATGIVETWNPGQFDKRSGQWIGGDKMKNIEWVAKLGATTYSTPIVSGEKVFCGTNNKSGLDPKYPADVDLGVLVVLNLADGRFLGQFAWEKLDGALDWPEQGLCSNPTVQGNRLWVVSNRSEVVCLNTEPDVPEVLWSFNMMERLKTKPHHMSCCSVLILDDLLFTGTSNGVGPDEKSVVAPSAPSFIALDKTSGELIWSDASPGENILDGQWGSPCALQWTDASGKSRTQVVFPGGDGWLYAFEVLSKEEAGHDRPRILKSWKFDCNPKDSVWKGHGNGDRNILVATPVVHQNRVFIATGQDPESGEGPGVLWCVEPLKILEKFGEQAREKNVNPDSFVDVSENLVVDSSGKPVPPRRTKAVDESQGEKIVPNPDSAAVWSYRGKDPDSKEFEDRFHRTIGSVVVTDENLLLVGDFSGVVHCLEASSGKCCWTYDVMSTIWGGALAVDGKFFIGDSEGDVAIFKSSPKLQLFSEINMGSSIYGSPTVADDSMLISTDKSVYSLKNPKK